MTADASKLVERLLRKADLEVDSPAPHLTGDMKFYVYEPELRALLREAADALEAARVEVASWRSPNPYLHSCCRESVDEVCQDIEAAICGATGANDEG